MRSATAKIKAKRNAGKRFHLVRVRARSGLFTALSRHSRETSTKRCVEEFRTELKEYDQPISCKVKYSILGVSALPDHRKHRGPHPEDRQLFGVEQLASLRAAARDLSWLLTQGYASPSALKLVGDRHRLNVRQRLAVARCACGDPEVARRQRHEVQVADLKSQELWIDGYNVLTSLEAALSGGVILAARDGCYRDIASMHGNYRKVDETLPVIQIVGELAAQWQVAACHWLLDQPVSNSGRLKSMLLAAGQEHGWDWQVKLVPDPDAVLKRIDNIVASSDSQILDQAQRWFNLARVAIESRAEDAWVLDLSG